MPSTEAIAGGGMIFTRVNPLTDPTWDETVACFPNSTFFHSSTWLRVLAESYGLEPIALVGRNPAGEIAALLPLLEVDSWVTGRRGVSLPFTDECELLGARTALRGLPTALAALAAERGWQYWELRGGARALAMPAAVAFHGHRLDLTGGPARLLAGCSPAVRWAIRRSEQTALTVTFGHDLTAVRAFHALVCRTRKRHGQPPQPLQFFERLQRHALGAGRGCVVLARLGAKPIAGALFLHFGRTAIFKFGASDSAHHALHPNNLVLWRAIEWHARMGFASLDFGRTSLGQEGLRHFKLGWGTTERRIEYVRFDCRDRRHVVSRDRSSGWPQRIFRFVPMGIARAFGAAAYRHVA